MRIGIDIDDVITDTSGAMKKYIDKYDKNSDIHNHIQELMRGEMPTQEIKDFFKNNSYDIFKNAKVKENASQVIDDFLNMGNEVFIITSRGEIKFEGSENLSLEYLKNNKINYTKIIFNVFDKAKICKENKIDVMVDDSNKFCTEIAKENMKSILFTSVVNKDDKTIVSRVNNWLELKNEIYKINN